ncbi:MAG: M81 family metallopeptidase [Spirochaetota bacterium]
MRFFVAGIATEVNTFSPIFIDMDAFEKGLLARPNQHPETATLCTSSLIHAREWARQGVIELVEGTTCWADPGGMVKRQTYETLRDEILQQLAQASSQGKMDAVILCLHGAMVVDGYMDPEGDLLERVRRQAGKDTIISVGLDPHSHLTEKRLSHADIMVAFKEFPHTDFSQRGREVVAFAIQAVERKIKPVLSAYDCKMIDIFPTNHPQMRAFVDKMQALENDASNSVVSISLIHGFMAGDVPEMGTKVLVLTDNDRRGGDALAAELGREVFAMRGKCAPAQLNEVEALQQAQSLARTSSSPVVVADMWDNPGGGVAGDATVILKEALRQKIAHIAFATIWDPIAVKLCCIAGEGAVIPLRFGAKSAPFCGEPLDASVRVKKIVFDAKQTFCGSIVNIGDSVLLEVEGIEVILNSVRAQVFERTVFTIFGIDPLAKDILVVKSTNHFYGDFSKLAEHILYCDAGNPYPNHPRTTPYIHAPKNIWPLVAEPAR